MPSSDLIVRSLDRPEDSIQWDDRSPIAGKHSTRQGDVIVAHGRFRGGSADAVEVVTIDTGPSVTWVLPTRGMSIWKIRSGGKTFGWRSPVHGPVHPSRVPIMDPSGLGWLEGFDELMVRCGLESNGAPEFDDAGRLLYPLHGRIGNLPAEALSLTVDAASGRLDLNAEILESRLFFKRLHLRTRLRFTAGSVAVDVLDDVTNDLSTPATMQLLYHINCGESLVSSDSKISASLTSITPKDSHSAGGLERWNICDAPRSGQQEQVYFGIAKAGDDGRAVAMLQSADESASLAVSYAVSSLPCMSIWKNAAAKSDGYVVGLEPATNFPNRHSVEKSAGRMIKLAAGETRSFRLSLYPLTETESIASMRSRIATNQGNSEITLKHDLN